MKKRIALAVLVAALPTLFVISTANAQQTPGAMVATYEALADAILAVREAEANFVRSVLEAHLELGEAAMAHGEAEAAAAQIALFANEGDNAIAGVRKRLLEGGHHHNAAGEEQGVYEPGFVIVTRAAKEEALRISSELRRAQGKGEQDKAWGAFKSLAERVLQEP